MMSGSDPQPNSAETTDLVFRVATRVNRLQTQVLGNLDIPLTHRQHRLLIRIGEGYNSAVALCAFGNLSMPTVSESLTVLVRRALVTRSESPLDRRISLVELTESGRTASKAAQVVLAQTSDQLLDGLSPSVRAQLMDLLGRIFDEAAGLFDGDADQGD
jgi:DNA-binding MarR family transcriptional regulator